MRKVVKIEMGMPTNSDQNLLFGIIALQMDFVHREQLVAAASTWLTSKSRKIEEILVEQGALTEADRRLLAPLVARHVENHHGDPQQSLAALSSIGSVGDELRSLGDADIGATLSIVTSDRAGNLHEQTSAHESRASTAKCSARDAKDPRFRILRSHAKGGLGEVYLAKDTELNRDVALKEIQSRFADDESSRLRFLLEAEMTGGLEHPGIVPVYGLGRYDDGRPFYAMRFIKGDSLQEAVNRLHGGVKSGTSSGEGNAGNGDRSKTIDYGSVDFRKLLGRFVDVCEAIEYAHSRGVLHRDLKPGNIMLGKYGETLVVDWGLAKVQGRKEIDEASGETTLRPASASGSVPTMIGTAIGTPSFMPPEQAAGQLDELGPASDVYSLGATLYYMLTGTAPFTRKDLPTVLKQVQAGDFPSPRDRHSDVPKPLNAICLRAMATEPAGRYASPQALADDVERFLADEPVSAHAEPVSLRIRRWVRKHPRSVAALAATVLVGLISSSIIAAVVSHNAEIIASQNRDLTVAQADLEESNINLDQANRRLIEKNRELETANAAERKAKEDAQTVITFFADNVLARARPESQEGGLGINATIREAIDVAEGHVAHSFADRPLVEAPIRHTLGLTYGYLGDVSLAVEQLERAAKLRESELGWEHADTLVSMGALANAYRDAGRLNDALAIHEKCLTMAAETLGPEHESTLNAMDNLAATYKEVGQTGEALVLFEKSLEVTSKSLGTNHLSTRKSMNNLATIYQAAGRLEDAVSLLEQTLKLEQAARGPEAPDTLTVQGNLASAYLAIGRSNDAIPLLEQTLKIGKTKLGLEHPAVALAMNELAMAYSNAGRAKDALPLLEEALELSNVKLGPDHPQTLALLSNLGTTYLDLGLFSNAVEANEATLGSKKQKLGLDHPATIASMINLAQAYKFAGRLEDALQLMEESLKLAKAKLGPKHPVTLTATNNLGSMHLDLRQFAKAVPLLEESLRLSKEKLGPTHPDTLVSMVNLAGVYEAIDRREEGISLLKETLKQARRALEPNHPITLTVMNNLAAAYQRSGRLDDALPLAKQVLTLRRAKLGPEHPSTVNSLNNLAKIYLTLGRIEESLKLLEEAFKLAKANLGPENPQTLTAMGNLAETLREAGRIAEALPLMEEKLRLSIQVLGPANSETLNSMGKLGSAYLQAGQPAKGLPLFEGLVEGFRQQAPPNDPRFADFLMQIADELLPHQPAAAEPHLREALEIRERTMAGHWLSFNTRSILGSALLKQKRFEAAEPLLLEGYRGLKEQEETLPEPVRTHITEAVQRLVELYDAWEKPTEAAKWQAELNDRTAPEEAGQQNAADLPDQLKSN